MMKILNDTYTHIYTISETLRQTEGSKPGGYEGMEDTLRDIG